MSRIALPVAATVAALVVATVPAAIATEPETSGLAITKVEVNTDSGGYPLLSWGWHGLDVEFADSTPRRQHRYVVSVVPAAGGDALTATWDPYRGWDGTGWATVGTDGDFTADEAYDVTVAEYDDDVLVESSEPVSFRPTVVGHPTSGTLEKKGRKGVVRAGTVVRIRWTGEWEEGIRLTQVVAARPTDGFFSERQRDFLVCENSYCPTRRGVRWVTARDNPPVTRFRVPRRFAGKTLVIASFGNQGDQGRLGPTTRAPWGWSWTLKVRR